jgi:hypothetical protein
MKYNEYMTKCKVCGIESLKELCESCLIDKIETMRAKCKVCGIQPTTPNFSKYDVEGELCESCLIEKIRTMMDPEIGDFPNDEMLFMEPFNIHSLHKKVDRVEDKLDTLINETGRLQKKMDILFRVLDFAFLMSNDIC